MCMDHRYPEEVKQDYRMMVAIKEHPEIKRMVSQHGRLAVIGAAVVIQERAKAREVSK